MLNLKKILLLGTVITSFSFIGTLSANAIPPDVSGLNHITMQGPENPYNHPFNTNWKAALGTARIMATHAWPNHSPAIVNTINNTSYPLTSFVKIIQNYDELENIHFSPWKNTRFYAQLTGLCVAYSSTLTQIR